MNRPSARDRLAGWAPLLLWMGLIFVLSSQPDRPHLAEPSIDRLLEPLGHTLEYGVLAHLWVRALRGEGLAPTHVLWTSLLLSWLYALSDEWHQSYVAGREADLVDLAFDTLGMGMALMGWTRSGRK